jgi:hypothetical protein
MDTTFDDTSRPPDVARRSHGGGPEYRILASTPQSLLGVALRLLSSARNRCRYAVCLLLQELGALTHNCTRGAQFEIKSRPDRLPIDFVGSRFRVPPKLGDLTASTIHEFRNAFAHASLRPKGRPSGPC